MISAVHPTSAIPRFQRAHHAKRRFLSQTFADHFFVARFEDVQRQGRTRKEHDFQRK
jgi:hypothetical protein